ncbi:late transcription unit protein LtuB [Candidatus Chlamydia corallus]|uniref:late transcription unit protein LtuB n=1 Tax=Candidatus Chlamydia corallus TaxID=2038470 RepID=UPI000C2FB8B4|nr:late transcription unit protein LtuB [Candidatus Chlamydia corallus]
MGKPKKSRTDRALARAIQKKSTEVLKKPKQIKNKNRRAFVIAKEQKTLKHRAQEYDQLVRSLLDSQKKDIDKVLIFNYENGFIFTDKDNFSKYSVRL